MKKGWRKWALASLIVLLAASCVPTARAAHDQYLVLSAPMFVGNKVHFTITGEADAVYVIESSPDGIWWTPMVTNYDRTITRLISLDRSPNADYYRGWRRRLPVFSAALAARTSIDFSYSNLSVDSYDSSNPECSTGGLYDPAKRKAGGDVATIDGAVNVGNARINGRIRTGTKGAFSFGPNGLVGPVNWPGPGLYAPDWYRKDFRFVIPDVPFPYTNGIVPMPLTGGTNGWALGSGNYYLPENLTMKDQVLLVTGDARLYVKGSVSMSPLSEIRISPGASLQLYVGGTNATITRVTTLDPSANAMAFQYYGLPGNGRVVWSGNETFLGTVYAPSATFRLGGGGNNVMDFQGACAAGAIVLTGHCNFHFDENLAERGPQR